MSIFPGVRKAARSSGFFHQGGQSTVEFVVLGLVTVPLMLSLPLLGKYMDLAQTTAVASRYTAFEGTVRHSSSTDGWKTDAELATEVRRRFYGNSDAPIKTNDVAGDFNAHRNALWFDHRGKPLLPSFATDVGVRTQKDSLGQPFGAVFAGALGLSQENLYRGEVTANVANINGFKPFETLGLTITRHTTVLVDSWAASGPAAVASKVKGMGAGFPYQGLQIAALPVNPLITLFEFKSAPPEIGKVDPDVVPADRLQAYK